MRQLRHPRAEEITLAGVLGALSDPVRLSIVLALASGEGERAWGDFEVDVCASTLSHHLKRLRMAGLIEHRKEGTRCYVSLRQELERIFPGLLGCILESSTRGAGGGRAAGRPAAATPG